MFRPRHAYRSPITNRYRGKAKGCPVFNNLTEITSEMVEQHDECLECLAKLKNRTELYKTLADNNKPSNNVIKSLQRLSSSASNNRLKTCLQFLIIKVNEKSITTPANSTATAAAAAATTTTTTTTAATTTTLSNGCTSPRAAQSDATKDASFNNIDSDQIAGATSAFQNSITRYSTKRLKSSHHGLNKQHQRQKLHQLASPPQDQVSSTQDQVVGPTQDDHDCQTSPPILTTTQIDENLTVNVDTNNHKLSDEEKSPSIKNEEQQTEDICAQTATTTTTSTTTTTNIQLSSPPMKCNALTTPKATITTTTTTTSTTTSTSSSPRQVLDIFDEAATKLATISSDITYRGNRNNQIYKTNSTSATSNTNNTTTDKRQSPAAKRRKTQNSLSSDQDTSSVASWSLTSYSAHTPPSPASSTSSASSSSSLTSDTYSDSASSCCCSSCSSCTSSPRNSPSPYPSPDINNELIETRLKLDEETIQRIKNKPVLFDDLFCFSEQPSVASTPTTSSGCSPGQRSTATQNSEQSSVSCNIYGLSSTNPVIHMFQAPPTFVNSLKPCNLPIKSQERTPPSTTPAVAKAELISCAICGIRDRPPNIVNVYEQNSCTTCTKFFDEFLERPSQLYCRQDGDCLMTFDSRCPACWIKICLQKFDIDKKYRKIGEDFAPKLLSSPSVSLITIDTSVTT